MNTQTTEMNLRLASLRALTNHEEDLQTILIREDDTFLLHPLAIIPLTLIQGPFHYTLRPL